MREFIIAYMVEPIDVGKRFTLWPLHMTLLPWFDAPDVKAVKRELTKKLTATRTFEVSVGERSSFGVDKRLPVMLINPSPELKALHEKLLEMVEKNGWQLRGRYTGASFKPHITQKGGRDAEGTLHIDELCIIEAQPQNYREVVGKTGLPA
jgi:2'-5' RNA ligase